MTGCTQSALIFLLLFFPSLFLSLSLSVVRVQIVSLFTFVYVRCGEVVWCVSVQAQMRTFICCMRQTHWEKINTHTYTEKERYAITERYRMVHFFLLISSYFLSRYNNDIRLCKIQMGWWQSKQRQTAKKKKKPHTHTQKWATYNLDIHTMKGKYVDGECARDRYHAIISRRDKIIAEKLHFDCLLAWWFWMTENLSPAICRSYEPL